MTNVYVGMSEVADGLRAAARGMGMTSARRCSGRATGRRSAGAERGPHLFLQVVATSALAAVVAAGGLGRYVVDGFATQDYVQGLRGAVLVAVVALVAEAAGGNTDRGTTPTPSGSGHPPPPTIADPLPPPKGSTPCAHL